MCFRVNYGRRAKTCTADKGLLRVVRSRPLRSLLPLAHTPAVGGVLVYKLKFNYHRHQVFFFVVPSSTTTTVSL